MARYRNDSDDERDYPREERFRRESFGAYEEPMTRRREFERDRERERPIFGGGRFGERANYENDEPRYTNYRENRERADEVDRNWDQNRRSTLDDLRGDLSTRRRDDRYGSDRSRLRCREIMTKDLAVAQKDTPVTQVALMMKQEDTGVIPVVEYDVMGGNGRTGDDDRTEDRNDRRYENRNYSRGKLVGLITDRDIVVRGVAEGKECTTTRAEDIMSVDVHTVRPNDRIVDVINKMSDKQVRRIPVVNENNYLVGMISMADVAVETHDDRELGDALEQISKSTSFWTRLFG